MIRRHPQRVRGVLMIELAIATFVVFLLAVLTAQTILRFSHTRAHYAARETAAWAAEAQFARLQAGAPLASHPPEGMVPEGVSLETIVEPGAGMWSRLSLVRVRATIQPRHQKAIVEEVCGYVAAEGQAVIPAPVTRGDLP